MNPPSLLIVRFSAIGDCVMSAWAATAYRNRFPEGRLVWAIERRCRPVVDEVRLVSKVIEFPRDKWKANRWSPATWAEQFRKFGALRRERIEWGLDLQGHSKTALALRIANPRRRIAVEATDVVASRLNPLLASGPTGEHTVERNQRALGTFGEFALPQRPVMPQTDSLARDPKLITISVGAGSERKMWPAARWAATGAALMDKGFEVALLGGPDDPRVDLPGARDFVAKLPLEQTMNLVAGSVLHLAADTGTGHMAAGYGVPVVSVFGPSDSGRFRPYTTNGCVLRRGSETSSVTVEDVLGAAEALLAGATGGSVCASS